MCNINECLLLGPGSARGSARSSKRGGSQVAAKKVPWAEEVFRTPDEKHTRWSLMAVFS